MKLKYLITIILLLVLISGVWIIRTYYTRTHQISQQETPVLEGDTNVGHEATLAEPDVLPPLTAHFSFYDPVQRKQQAVDAEEAHVSKVTDSSIDYASFLVANKGQQQYVIDSAQSGQPTYVKSVLENVTTKNGLQGQMFTQRSAGVLITQYYFFDLGPDKILFLQTSVDTTDQKTVQEIINSLTF